jgi:hypothetical protein
MKTTIEFLKYFVLVALLVCQACKKGKDASPAFSSEIQKIVPQATIDSLRAKGMIINEGVTPPDLNGVFIASPYVLVSTYKDDTYSIGYQFSDLKLKFSGQNNANLGLTIQLKNGTATGDGVGAFISGSGNKFTIFAEVDLVQGSASAKQIRVFSGEIIDGALSNFYSSLHIKEKKDPYNLLIPVGQGRILKDGDGKAEKSDQFRLGAESVGLSIGLSDSELQ